MMSVSRHSCTVAGTRILMNDKSLWERLQLIDANADVDADADYKNGLIFYK